MDLSCLEQIIGITQRDCDCLETKPGGHTYGESLSGYYIDDIEHGIPLEFPSRANGCGDGTFWSTMESARTQGIQDFFTDLLAHIHADNANKYFAWSGNIGEINSNTPLVNTLNTYIGLKIDPLPIRGGLIKIHSLSLWTDSALSVDVKIYNQAFTELHTIPIVTQAGVMKTETLTTDIELPFYVNDERQTYWILYPKGTSKPYNIKFHCGCGQANKLKPYLQYGDFKGSRMDTLSLDAETTDSNYTLGLMLNASLSCEAMSWICFRDEEYITDPFARVMSKTVQLYAIKKLVNFVLNSTRINRWTILDREHLYGKVSHLQKEINNRLPWLALNLPGHAQDCFICKQAQKSTVRTIIV